MWGHRKASWWKELQIYLGKCRYGEVRGTGKIHRPQPVDLIRYLCDSGGGGGAGYGCVSLQVVNIPVTGQGLLNAVPGQ